MYKILLLSLLAAVPSSTNFTLKSYDFGSGADASSSSSYNLQASTGAPQDNLSSGSFGLPAGIRATTTVATPSAPTFTNPDSSYSQLRLALNVTGLPSDAKYLIAISDDDFITTKYVQTDNTIGTSLSLADYQSYAAWGGASGFWILGLDYNTTYKVRVAALQGAATGSGFGPSSTAATVSPTATFALSTSLTSTPPFSLAFTSLTPGSVMTANATVTADITSNALHGGSVLIKDSNTGLLSALRSYTVGSATADLAAANTGYGLQVTSTSQSSGGPITASSPFNGATDNVGGLTADWQELASFASGISSGSLTATLKARANQIVPASTDYSDIITLSILLSF